MTDSTDSWFLLFKASLLTFLLIISTISSILVLIYLYKQRRQFSIHLHTPLMLIVLSILQMTTDIPLIIWYHFQGIVLIQTDAFCLWWNWWSYSTSGSIIFFMAWACIERHILVFHQQWLDTTLKRVLFHFLPTMSSLSYPFLFYLVVVIFNSCENQWDYSSLLCLQPCYLNDQPLLSSIDFLVNVSLPIGIIAVANGILIGRICWQKRQWRGASSQQRKSTIQLSSIAGLYIIFWGPLTVNGLIYTFSESELSLDLQEKYFLVLPTVVVLLLPPITLVLLPNFKKVMFSKRHMTIVPQNTMTDRGPVNDTRL